MRRQLNILEYALSSLARRWKKQLSLVGIYGLVVGFFASVIFFTSALRSETTQVLEDVPELWVQKLAGGRLRPMDTSFIDSLGKLRGVASIAPRIWGYMYDSPTGAVFTITGSDSLPKGLSLVQTQLEGALKPDEVLCGTGILEQRGLFLGDWLTMANSEGELKTFRIAGTFDAKSDLLTKDLLVLSPSSARDMIGLDEGEMTDLAIEIINPDEVENIAKKIDMAFGGIRVVSKMQLQSTYEALFSWRGGIFIYGAIISILAFLTLAWDKASGLNSEEKKELGILKGVGWEISDVLWMKFWEGAAVSVTATLLGIMMALGHVFIFDAPLLKPFLIGWSVVYPSYNLTPSISLGDLLSIVSISVIPYLSATLIPAWKGAITDPAQVMQEG
ncbi:ABC transporter permease [Flammeovirgaceae bacterium SG7u.111]|nr:ABC transporter permease [Flammeovirgaceae bacterium SG7u.132]WPO35926.1 ABC transporter permease [Flammeovirgaceae bacterium SG7u.111]